MRSRALIFFIAAVLVIGGVLWLRSLGPSVDQKIAACKGLQSGSVQTVKETTRLFINLPKDLYPDKGHALAFMTASGTARANWISNAGPYGQAYQATDDCWSYYYELDGVGELDLTASGTAPYRVRFIVR